MNETVLYNDCLFSVHHDDVAGSQVIALCFGPHTQVTVARNVAELDKFIRHLQTIREEINEEYPQLSGEN